MTGVEIKVGIADMNIAYPPDKIMTIGLGSCVGILLYDKFKSLGGLVHIMLPDSTQFRDIKNPLKFADLGIPLLIEKMEKEGSSKRNLIAKIAGGASMFNFSDKSMISDIGKRNGEAVVRKLDELKIPIISSDLGGNKGRTMIADVSTGKVTIRIVGQGTIEI